MANLSKLQKSQKELQGKIDSMIAALDRDVNAASGALVNVIIQDFMSKLSTIDGVIINDAQNLRLVSIIDGLYAKFNKKENLRVVAGMADNIGTINALNSNHFAEMYTKPIKPITKAVEATVNNRFGINPDGTLIREGYMMGLLDDVSIRNTIKQMAFKAVQNASGWNDFAIALKQHIEGDKDKLGIFQRFYRNYAYDVYSQADRLNSVQYANRLGLNYAIYEGGLIETSRKFCIEKNGKVFSREEIMAFKLTEAAPPDYDPITDLGGYGCRHYLNWISDELAFMLRPDLKEKAEKKKEPKPSAPPEPVAQGQPTPTPPEPKPVAPTIKVPKAGKKPVEGSKAAPPAEKVPDLKTVNDFKNWLTEQKSYARDAVISEEALKNPKTKELVNKSMSELNRLYDKYELRKIDKFKIAPLDEGTNAQYVSVEGIEFNGLEINSNYLANPAKKLSQSTIKKQIDKALATKKFNPKAFEGNSPAAINNRKILENLEERAKYKRWSISNDKQDPILTLTHEIGHKLHDEYFGMSGNRSNLNSKLSDSQRKELSLGLDQLFKESKSNGDIYSVSEYGSTNEKEFFTESFVLYEKYPKELPPKIKSFIEKVIGYAKR